MTQFEMETLSDEESWELLSQQSVGRFVFSDDAGVGAIPVNFSAGRHEVVFRVSEASHLRQVISLPVAFEVDELHPVEGTGWSVLVRGTAREVPVSEVADLIERVGHVPRPTAEGVHNVWLSLKPEQVTGRRLGHPFVSTLP